MEVREESVGVRVAWQTRIQKRKRNRKRKKSRQYIIFCRLKMKNIPFKNFRRVSTVKEEAHHGSEVVKWSRMSREILYFYPNTNFSLTSTTKRCKTLCNENLGVYQLIYVSIYEKCAVP